jgi:hypothetical protein
MNHPKSVQIGGNEISVSLIDSCHTCNDSDHIADFYRDKNEIRVAKLCPDGTPRCSEFLNLTLWHEYMEAVNEIFVCNLEHDNIDRIAQGIVQILNQSGIKLIREE